MMVTDRATGTLPRANDCPTVQRLLSTIGSALRPIATLAAAVIFVFAADAAQACVTSHHAGCDPNAMPGEARFVAWSRLDEAADHAGGTANFAHGKWQACFDVSCGADVLRFGGPTVPPMPGDSSLRPPLTPTLSGVDPPTIRRPPREQAHREHLRSHVRFRTHLLLSD